MDSSIPPNIPATDDPPIEIVQGTLEHIFISPGHDYWRKSDAPETIHGIRDVAEVRCLQGRGLKGDRYCSGKLGKMGQVTFFEAETVDAVREHFQRPGLEASLFRRNLIVRGVRLSTLLGRRFIFQNVVFEGAQECKPCVWMDRKVVDGAQAFLRQSFRGGLRARICTTGYLRVSPPTAALP